MQSNYMLVCVPHLATFPSERQIEVYTSPNQYLSEMLLDLQAFKTTPTTSNQNVNPLYMNNDVYQCLPYANINIRMDTTCIQYAIFVNMSGLNSSSVYIPSYASVFLYCQGCCLQVIVGELNFLRAV